MISAAVLASALFSLSVAPGELPSLDDSDRAQEPTEKPTQTPGGAAPGGEVQPPAESQPPAGETTPPAETKPPADETTPPAGDTAPPAGDTAPPEGAPPSGGEGTGSGGQTTPPAESGETPPSEPAAEGGDGSGGGGGEAPKREGDDDEGGGGGAAAGAGAGAAAAGAGVAAGAAAGSAGGGSGGSGGAGAGSGGSGGSGGGSGGGASAGGSGSGDGSSSAPAGGGGSGGGGSSAPAGGSGGGGGGGGSGGGGAAAGAATSGPSTPPPPAQRPTSAQRPSKPSEPKPEGPKEQVKENDVDKPSTDKETIKEQTERKPEKEKDNKWLGGFRFFRVALAPKIGYTSGTSQKNGLFDTEKSIMDSVDNMEVTMSGAGDLGETQFGGWMYGGILDLEVFGVNAWLDFHKFFKQGGMFSFLIGYDHEIGLHRRLRLDIGAGFGVQKVFLGEALEGLYADPNDPLATNIATVGIEGRLSTDLFIWLFGPVFTGPGLIGGYHYLFSANAEEVTEEKGFHFSAAWSFRVDFAIPRYRLGTRLRNRKNKQSGQAPSE